MRQKWPLLAQLFLLLLFCADLLSHYPQLPDAVASHFTATGRANSFMSKSSFSILALATSLGMCALFNGIPLLLQRLPSDFINLPHRDYWLAPEHRSATFDFFRTAFSYLGTLHLAILMAIFHLALTANLHKPAVLSPFIWVLLPLLLAGTLLWAFGLIRSFNRLPRV